MNIKKIVCALTLSLTVALPLTAAAHNISIGDSVFENNNGGVLYKNAKHNKHLGDGEYGFVGLHTQLGSTFSDEWKFTLADTSNVVISLADLAFPLGGDIKSLADDFSGDRSHQHGHHRHSSSNALLDNKFLTFSLFDSQDHLLGSAGEGGSISALGLAGGQWYTLMVSAKVNGIFGSVYRGTLDITQPTAVPLGDSLPMFASALLVMMIRAKKRQAV